MKQSTVSERTGIPVNSLSKIERAQMAIDSEQITTLAQFYGMLPEELWHRARVHSATLTGGEPLYQADGSLDASAARDFEPSDSDIQELLSRDKRDTGEG